MQLDLLIWRVVGGSAVAVGTLALASCQLPMELPPDGPVALSTQENKIVVTMCERIEVTSFSMSERSTTSAWNPFWESDKGFILEAGQSISAANAADFGVAVGGQPALNAGDQLLIQFVGQEPSFEDTVNAGFTIPKDGVPEGQWLQTNGDVTAEACPAVG